jgi:hypothetical protein
MFDVRCSMFDLSEHLLPSRRLTFKGNHQTVYFILPYALTLIINVL